MCCVFQKESNKDSKKQQMFGRQFKKTIALKRLVTVKAIALQTTA